MKKILFLFAFLALGMSAKAQYVSNLDEIELLGTWKVTAANGDIMGISDIVTSFTFNDGKDSFVEFSQNHVERVPIYIVGGTATGRYTLHLMRKVDYDGYLGISSVNFEVYQFGNNTMTLRTYVAGQTVWIQNEPYVVAGVVSREKDKASGKAYTLDGMTATDTTKGIIIQNGKKKIRK